MPVEDAHRPLRWGDVVEITYDGRVVEGTVVLASPNGRSLVLRFDAMLGGHVGMMPVYQEEDGEYVSLIERHEVGLKFVCGYDPDNPPLTTEQLARMKRVR